MLSLVRRIISDEARGRNETCRSCGMLWVTSVGTKRIIDPEAFFSAARRLQNTGHSVNEYGGSDVLVDTDLPGRSHLIAAAQLAERHLEAVRALAP